MSARPNKVVVFDTGGTFSMKLNDQGLLVPSTPKEAEAKIQAVFNEHKKLWPESAQCRSLEYTYLSPKIDSSAATPRNWVTIAERVQSVVTAEDVAGVIVIHGTDTLAYSAAAVPFLLPAQRKPVVFTAAQMSIFQPGNDAYINFVRSLEAVYWHSAPGAPPYFLAGVYVAFGEKLMTAAAIKKVSSESFAGFDTPRVPLLGNFYANNSLRVYASLARKLYGKLTAAPSADINPIGDVSVLVLHITPGINLNFFPLTKPSGTGFIYDKWRVLIIEAYGAGNGPVDKSDPKQRETFLDPLLQFLNAGGFVAVVSECLDGRTARDYASCIAVYYCFS